MRFLFRKLGRKLEKPSSAGHVPFKLRAVVDVKGKGDLLEKLQTVGGLRLFPDADKQKQTAHSNGLKAFVPEINKISLVYNPNSKKSANLMSFIQTGFKEYAAGHPFVEFALVPSVTSKPMISALYSNGRVKFHYANNENHDSIVYRLNELINQSSKNPQKYDAPVQSEESTVPLWDPFHSEKRFTP